MHMADALLSPAVGTTFWAGSFGVIAYCSKRLKEQINDKITPLMGIIAAFVFAAQMINFTIPGTGSSGHIGGGMLLAILLGPYAAFVAIASVLSIQCLFFADGGILALGSNIWNLGIYPCFIAYPLIYKPIVRSGSSSGKTTIASIASVVAALQLGAFSVVIQTVLSGRSELPLGTFAALMLPIHLAIGLVEGFVTAGVVNFVRKSRPEILESVEEYGIPASGHQVKKLIAGFALIAVITGGLLSWFASTHPDGLEWSIEKIHGSPELSGHERGIISKLEDIQEKTAILPDYDFAAGVNEETDTGEESWPAVSAGTSVSGVLGAAMVMGFIIVFGFALRRCSIKNT
jgi:cobalt/nickel transport system permease protein